MHPATRLILALILFASVASVAYAIGAMFSREFVIWRWPASYQVGGVLFSVICTAVLWGLLGIGRNAEPWDQFDHYEEDRR